MCRVESCNGQVDWLWETWYGCKHVGDIPRIQLHTCRAGRVKDQTVCVCVMAVVTSIVGFREIWIKYLLGCWRLENFELRYRFLNHFSLRRHLRGCEEDVAVCLLHKRLLPFEGISWRCKEWNVTGLQGRGQHYQVP